MKNLLNYVLIVLLSCNSFLLRAQNSDFTENKPAYSAEQMPQFPGGDEALMNFIRENLKYPMKAAENGIEGRVYIRFVIDRVGSVTDVTVIRSLDSYCDKEAVRVVKMMPNWTPGKQNGKTIPVYFTLPIVYKLQKGNVIKTSQVDDNSPLLIVDGIFKPYSLLQDTIKLKPSSINSITVLKDTAAEAAWGSRGKNGVIRVETKGFAARMDSAIRLGKPLYSVDFMPQFPGGDQALLTFIKKNLRYPNEDARRGIQGRTTIRFVVSKTGQVTDVTIIRGLSPACDAEAVRVVKLMPKWKPGSYKGTPVDVYYTLPIVYKLQR